MDYTVVLTREELDEVLEHYMGVDAFSFDVETVGDHRGDPQRNHVMWLSLACGTRTEVIPLGHPNGELVQVVYPLLKSGREREAKGLILRKSDFSVDATKAVPEFTAPPEQLSRSYVLDALRPLFVSDALKIAHNLKFDLNSLRKYVPITGPFWDTQTAEWVVDSSLHGRLKLSDCVARRLGITMDKGIGVKVEAHTFDDVADYSALDARVTYDLFVAQQKPIEETRSEAVIDLEMQLLEVLADMERTGIRLDMDRLKLLDEHVRICLDKCLADAYRAAGRTFNINSVQEKQRLLYSSKKEGGRGLRGKVLTDGGLARRGRGEAPSPLDYSTSSEALSQYRDPLARALRDYAKFTKLSGTYIRPYLGGQVSRKRGDRIVTEYVESQAVAGRIHTRFVQDRVETGRLSSRSPNLMNVPARTSEGKKIRDLFVASEGCLLVQADYSQIEPRIIADLSGDPILRQTYLDKGDVYVVIADRLGVDRSVGKTLVLSIAYGIGPATIADRTGMTTADARGLMDYFSAKFPRILAHKRSVLSRTRSRRPYYSETVLGRRRYLPHMGSRDPEARSSAERKAYNHLIQGSAADVMKVALVRVHRTLFPGAQMLLTVHDEIVLECPEEDAEEAAAVLGEQMELAGRGWFGVPLVAETKIVERWGECK